MNAPGGAKDYYSRSLQLHQVLTSFQRAMSQELKTKEEPLAFMALSSAMGICFSAIIHLYDAHTCADLDDPSGVGIAEQLKIQEISLTGLHNVLPLVCEFASTLQVMFSLSQSRKSLLSPFVAEALFSAAKQYLWYIRETGKMELLSSVEVLTGALRLLGEKWQVASKSLREEKRVQNTVSSLFSNGAITQMSILKSSKGMSSRGSIDFRILSEANSF